MTRKELLRYMTEQVGNQDINTMQDAESALNAVLGGIEAGLKSEAFSNEVKLVGFGVFRVSSRKGRVGRNPLTGEAIDIAPSKTVRFKAGKSLKESIK